MGAAPTPSARSTASGGEPLAVLLRDRERFLRFLQRRLGSREEAEDLLQEAYLRGIGRLGGLREREKVTAWFTRILKNSLTDRHRRRAAERRALERLSSDPTESPGGQELQEAACDCVHELLPTLRAEYAEALRRVDLGGARVADFARDAGISAGNASVRLHRARAAMRRRLLETCGCCAEHGCTGCDCRREGGRSPVSR
jgi:RNA polymerase sigma-70 factor (ECF subfamily)